MARGTNAMIAPELTRPRDGAQLHSRGIEDMSDGEAMAVPRGFDCVAESTGRSTTCVGTVG